MISFLYVWFFVTTSALIGIGVIRLMKKYVWTKKKMFEAEAVEFLKTKIEYKTSRSYNKAFTPFYDLYKPYAEEHGLTIAPKSTARQALNPNVEHVSKPELVVDMLKYCGEEVEIIKAS